YPLGCDWSAKEIISKPHHFRNLTFPVSFPICSYSVKRVDQPHFSVRASRVQKSSARAQHELTAIKIFCPNDLTPMESMSQLFILLTHLHTFFMNSLPLLNSSIKIHALAHTNKPR